MRLPALGLVLCSGLAFEVQAQVVQDCQWEGMAQALVEPWEKYSRTFANGKTRLALLDRLEPGVGPLHLLILSPPLDPVGGRQCKVISLNWQMGFAEVFWGALNSGYDPAEGLLFDLPVAVYTEASGDTSNAMLSFSINQASGAIDARLNPAD